MNTKTPALTFPCEFPIKIFGYNSTEFEREVLAIVHTHFADLREDAIENRLSKDEKYLSITVTVTAQEKAQLDALYQELTALKSVLMAL